MRKFLISLAIVSTALAAAPAMAQGRASAAPSSPIIAMAGRRPMAAMATQQDRGGYDRGDLTAASMVAAAGRPCSS